MNLFRRYFGPVKNSFNKMEEEAQHQLFSLLADIYQLVSRFVNDILTITNGEYLEVIATRR